MKINFFIIFLIITFKLKQAQSPEHINRWVVWNIGQGQWVTHVLSDECLHYDMGGEFGSFKNIKKTLVRYCGNKPNRLNLSHWDYDHFLNIPAFVKAVPRLCWQNIPEFAHNKQSAKFILDLKIPTCKQKNEGPAWIPFIARNTNESCLIYFEERVLIPGDSPIQQEKYWSNEIENIELTRVLVLGHHGSRTSTGKELLKRLPRVKFSIASARYAKYRHPHQETLMRLSDYNIPILKTEDWGNIWFE